jgi:NitT/TauT family transport system substrate-binding protein
MQKRASRSVALRLGFAALAAPYVVGAQELPTIRLGMAEGDDATPTLYALKVGIFKKYGLNVEVTRMPSGAAGLAALAGGSVDASATSLLPFISARGRGLPLQIIAPLAAYNPESPYAAIIVRKEAPYTSGKDLNGKTIASPALRDLNWVASMAWIDQNGGDSTTVKSVELVPSAIPPAIVEGRVDAATVTTPRYVEAVKTDKIRVLGHSYEAIAKRFTFAAIAATADFTAKHGDLVPKFGRALREATRYTNTHHADTVELYAGFAKIDPKVIVDAPRAYSQEYVEAKDLQPMIDIAVKYKVIPSAPDPREMLSPAILKPGA